VLLRYPKLRVVLHAGSLVPGQQLRFAVHGTRASYLKQGLDPQEDALRKGGIPGQAGWGIDPLPGELRTGTADSVKTETVQGIPGDYVRYYAAMRDAILRGDPAPVTSQEALQVMAMLEWGLESSTTHREIACR
jgi:predicted dehydrogenase